MTELLLTTRQVAEMLAVSSETVLRRWRAASFPASGSRRTCSAFAPPMSKRG